MGRTRRALDTVGVGDVRPQHLQPAASDPGQPGDRRDLVLPANDTLFTSGTLGRYSAMLNDVQQFQANQPLIQIQAAD